MMEKDGGSPFWEPFRGKHVLFLTTKNLDYLRNTQEIEALRAVAASVTVFGSGSRNYPARLLSLYTKLCFRSLRRFDAVFVGFAPQLVLPFWGWKLRRGLLGEDFFISLYDTLVDDRKKFKPGSLPARLLHRLDAATLRRADFITADTRAHAEFFAREFGADARKTHVLYLEADRSVYSPRQVPKDPVFEGRFEVLYFGSVLPLQGVEVVLECVRLMKSCPFVAFELIGPVPEREQAECVGCSVRFTPWLSQPELAKRIAAADFCLAGHFNAEIEKARRTIPGKAYIYEAMRKPMVLGDNPANRELFTEDASHRFVPMGSAEALRRLLLDAAKAAGYGA